LGNYLSICPGKRLVSHPLAGRPKASCREDGGSAAGGDRQASSDRGGGVGPRGHSGCAKVRWIESGAFAELMVFRVLSYHRRQVSEENLAAAGKCFRMSGRVLSVSGSCVEIRLQHFCGLNVTLSLIHVRLECLLRRSRPTHISHIPSSPRSIPSRGRRSCRRLCSCARERLHHGLFPSSSDVTDSRTWQTLRLMFMTCGDAATFASGAAPARAAGPRDCGGKILISFASRVAASTPCHFRQGPKR